MQISERGQHPLEPLACRSPPPRIVSCIALFLCFISLSGSDPHAAAFDPRNHERAGPPDCCVVRKEISFQRWLECWDSFLSQCDKGLSVLGKTEPLASFH